MKCPKCGYFGPDSLNTCKKCGKDLSAEKAKLGLSAFKTRASQSRPTPKRQPIPSIFVPEKPISTSPLPEKTAQLFIDEPLDTPIAPPLEPQMKKQDFPTEPLEVKFDEPEKPLDEGFLFETKPEDAPVLATPGEATQDVSTLQGNMTGFEFPEDITKIPPRLNALSTAEETSPSDKPTDVSDEQEKTASLNMLQSETILPNKELSEVPLGKLPTEPLDDEEIARILEDFNPDTSEPGKVP